MLERVGAFSAVEQIGDGRPDVPTEFQGRVGTVYMMGVQGGLVVGAGIGGLIARAWGVTGPFWFAFAPAAKRSTSIETK